MMLGMLKLLNSKGYLKLKEPVKEPKMRKQRAQQQIKVD
jgi:hypothetical protein